MNLALSIQKVRQPTAFGHFFHKYARWRLLDRRSAFTELLSLCCPCFHLHCLADRDARRERRLHLSDPHLHLLEFDIRSFRYLICCLVAPMRRANNGPENFFRLRRI